LEASTFEFGVIGRHEGVPRISASHAHVELRRLYFKRVGQLDVDLAEGRKGLICSLRHLQRASKCGDAVG
jgi:hypothetical protein